jgi:hypothetical protein
VKLKRDDTDNSGVCGEGERTDYSTTFVNELNIPSKKQSDTLLAVMLAVLGTRGLAGTTRELKYGDFVLFDVTRNMQTTYPKILQSMGITMVPILYPRTSACSTAHSKRDC